MIVQTVHRSMNHGCKNEIESTQEAGAAGGINSNALFEAGGKASHAIVKTVG